MKLKNIFEELLNNTQFQYFFKFIIFNFISFMKFF